MLIAGLFWQRARKRKTEAVLRESEHRFRVMADTTPSLIWMCDDKGNTTYVNARWDTFTGLSSDPGSGDSWFEHVHPDDSKNVSDSLARSLHNRHPFSREYRLRRSDGAYRWVLDVASPRTNGDGSFAGFIGSAIDVTDQKLAQEALASVSGRLIEAQEKERSRIARELHDDIAQRLALLAIDIEDGQNSGALPTAINQCLKEIERQRFEIAEAVRSLSHELHNSKLDVLGVVPAIRSLCGEVAGHHRLTIDFRDEGVPPDLPNHISLCIFRVAQEALHKH
jgi:PAS domain S-box-containing protein